ncbi:MAG: class I adenylate-forming enzyme family protein [Albidovulum sp.]
MISLSGQLRIAEIFSPNRTSLDGETLGNCCAADRLAANSCVAVSLVDPVLLIQALVALDGRVGAILLVSGALDVNTTTRLINRAGCDVLITDRDELMALDAAVSFEHAIVKGSSPATQKTSWLMTTSGTTGTPKTVPHTLQSLARSVYRFPFDTAPCWGLLYDPTRFAGLQVTLQALIGGGRLVAVDTRRPIGAQIEELARNTCTHLSATPTLWRRILMVPGHETLPLRQATLGGEIVDQATLDAVKTSFPNARITHIYASTEAGVGFSVNDGRAGFPRSYLQGASGGTKLKIADGVLWLRPAHAAPSHSNGTEVDKSGFVRSGDMILEDGERLFFLGRENGVINVGGVKIYPETVEDIVKAVPGVALVQVSSKKNPITGTLVVAEILLEDGANAATVKQTVLERCRNALVREAVPAIIRFVDGFETNAAGKLIRKEGFVG